MAHLQAEALGAIAKWLSPSGSSWIKLHTISSCSHKASYSFHGRKHKHGNNRQRFNFLHSALPATAQTAPLQKNKKIPGRCSPGRHRVIESLHCAFQNTTSSSRSRRRRKKIKKKRERKKLKYIFCRRRQIFVSSA